MHGYFLAKAEGLCERYTSFSPADVRLYAPRIIGLSKSVVPGSASDKPREHPVYKQELDVSGGGSSGSAGGINGGDGAFYLFFTHRAGEREGYWGVGPSAAREQARLVLVSNSECVPARCVHVEWEA